MVIVTCPNCGAKNRVDESRAATMRPVCGRCKTPLDLTAAAHDSHDSSPSHPIEVTDATLMDTLQSAGVRPVLVDCWAPWCGPCRMLAPTMDRLAAESAGRFVVGKLNVDENPQVASEFQIGSIPAMLIFKRGKLVDKMIGLQPAEAILTRLATHM